MNIKNGEPPKDGKTYILVYSTGVISSGCYRHGRMGEPQQDTIAWRSDCSGRFGKVIHWFDVPVELRGLRL